MEDSEYIAIQEKHLEYAKARGVEKTYCPSEVARSLFPMNWRDKMGAVREVADDLYRKEKLIVLQYGESLNELPSEVKGHIRLKRGRKIDQ